MTKSFTYSRKLFHDFYIFLKTFQYKNVNIVFNNSHLYIPSWGWKIYYVAQTLRVMFINLVSLLFDVRQFQFRGWWRSVNDFIFAVEPGWCKCILLNKIQKQKFGLIYLSMIHYASDT